MASALTAWISPNASKEVSIKTTGGAWEISEGSGTMVVGLTTASVPGTSPGVAETSTAGSLSMRTAKEFERGIGERAKNIGSHGLFIRRTRALWAWNAGAQLISTEREMAQASGYLMEFSKWKEA
jgi:hypothetical protein